MNSPSRTAQPYARRLWVRAAIAAVIGVQLLGIAHLAVSPHTICWEHGDVVEVSTGGIAQSAAPAHADLANAGWHENDGARQVLAREHDQCAVLALRRSGWSVPELRSPLPGLPPESSGPPEEKAVPRGARLTFRLAPKQSPPLTLDLV